MVTMQKWLVDVKCDGCKGLFYRSAPNVIVPDADWPRNGELVVGYEIPNVPGWIRLQNGYYLPMHSSDGKVSFLTKVSTRTQHNNNSVVEEATKERIGSSAITASGQNDTSSLPEGNVQLALNTTAVAKTQQNGCCSKVNESSDLSSPTMKSKETVRAAVHMDAMAFGMGCCCLQITFQATDIEESRFIYDQLAVMAPM